MSVCTVFVFMALMEYCLVNIVLGEFGRHSKSVWVKFFFLIHSRWFADAEANHSTAATQRSKRGEFLRSVDNQANKKSIEGLKLLFYVAHNCNDFSYH